MIEVFTGYYENTEEIHPKKLPIRGGCYVKSEMISLSYVDLGWLEAGSRRAARYILENSYTLVMEWKI